MSLINAKLLRIKNKNSEDKQTVNLKTINGVNESKGMITMKIKIYSIEKNINVFIVDSENFNYDFLVGLDCIKKFRLTQNENMEITQGVNKEETTKTKMAKIPDVLGDKQEKKDVECSEIPENNILHKYQVNFNEHIKTENFKISTNKLDKEQKLKIDKLVDKYKSIFAKDKYDIGLVKDYEAHIDLKIEKYCYKRPYRCTFEDRREIEEQIALLLKNNLIEESYSPFAAPVTLAYKKDEEKKSRLCIDFRELNKIVIPQSQPFPLIDDLMVKTVNSKYFTTLDINSAFWSIPLKVQDRYKTGFITQEGHFQWTCLPFGLKTAPAIFQRILSNIIRKHNLSAFAINFIDDILIFSKTFDEHMEHVSRLLEAILQEGFRLKLSKCTIADDHAKYLGHLIKNNTITPLKDYLSAVKDFPVPETRKNIRQFLGKVNFHHKFIPHSATTLDPLHNLLRKDVRFHWSKECQESFEKVKLLMCSEPILKIFDPESQIVIYTDASKKGVGAVLKQKNENGQDKPVAYFSKKLSESQKKRKPIYLECLAVVEAVKYWQHWLMGKEFLVYSDHKPLENLNIKARTDEELGDLTYYLSQYNLKIKYHPGKSNQEADCLSRNPFLEPHENADDFLKVVNFINLQDIKNDQSNNPEVERNKDKLIRKKEIYFKKVNKREKIMLSESLSKKLMIKVHETYCHIGRSQMINKITPYYTAKNIITNIKELCNNCEICVKNKSRRKPKYGLMSHLGPATYPFEIVSIDTIGGFGGSRSTKKYLHLLVDHFTRHAYILTSKNQHYNDFIKLAENATKNHKVEMMLTDQYPGINSKEFKKFVKGKNIKMVFTAVDAPFSNGLNERLNQTLINKIRCEINKSEKKCAWTTVAQKCVKSYNETEHTVTKFAPKYLLEGESINILPRELNSICNSGDLGRDRKLALENTIKSHNYNKNRFDSLRKELQLNVGDNVYVENGNKLNRKKLEELRTGPFQVVRKISNSIYEVNTGHRKKESNLFHVSKLTPRCDVAEQLHYE